MSKGEIYVCAECNGASREGHTPNVLVASMLDHVEYNRRGLREPLQAIESLNNFLQELASRDGGATAVIMENIGAAAQPQSPV